MAATRAGARFNDPHEVTVKVLAQGMLDVGMLDANKVGTVDDVIEKRAYFAYYMHRTGHWLGTDVRDCGSYVSRARWARSPSARTRCRARPSRTAPAASLDSFGVWPICACSNKPRARRSISPAM